MKQQFKLYLKRIQATANQAINQAKKNPPKFSNFKYNKSPPEMIAIDGSNRWLWYNPDLNIRIAVIRAAAAVYEYQSKPQPNLKLLESKKCDKAVLISPNNLDILNFDIETKTLHKNIIRVLGKYPTAQRILDHLRELEEYKLAEEFALKYSNSLIVIDGALTFPQVKELTDAARNLREGCSANNNVLIGVSKRNTTRRLKSNLTDEAVLNKLTTEDPRMLYTEIHEVPKGKQEYPVLGRTFLVKLHEKPIKSFRVDIVLEEKQKIEEIMSHLAYYSMVDAFLGYPFPLVDAHNIAALLRRVPDMYNNELIEAGGELGIGKEELLKHLISHEHVERDPFHRHLDDATK